MALPCFTVVQSMPVLFIFWINIRGSGHPLCGGALLGRGTSKWGRPGLAKDVPGRRLLVTCGLHTFFSVLMWKEILQIKTAMRFHFKDWPDSWTCLLLQTGSFNLERLQMNMFSLKFFKLKTRRFIYHRKLCQITAWRGGGTSRWTGMRTANAPMKVNNNDDDGWF